MKDKNLLLFLYPVSNLKMNEQKKILILQILDRQYMSVSLEEFDEVITKDFSLEDIQKNTQIKDNEGLKFFQIAKSILETIEYSKAELLKLQEVAKILKVKSEDTGFDFDLYNDEELNEFEFVNSVRKYSMVSAAVAFVPIPVADIIIITPLQVGLIAKIADIYKYKIEPKEFLKMLLGVIGAGLVFRTLSRVLNSFIPLIGWGINAAIAYSGTYAIGILTKRYLEANGELTKENIREIWDKSIEDGKKEFANLKDYIFKKKDELTKQFESIINKSGESQKDVEDDIAEFKDELDNKKTKTKKSGSAF